MAENFLKTKWRRFKRTRFGKWLVRDHDHYQRSFLITGIVLVLFLPFIIWGGGFSSLAQWYLYLYAPTAFAGGTLSGATYIGSLADKRTHRYEKAGLIALGILAIAATIAVGVLRFTVPFLDTFLSWGAYIIYGPRIINTIGSIGYRGGALGNSTRPTGERIFVAISAVVWGGIGGVICVKAGAILTTSSISTIVPGLAVVAVVPIIPATIITVAVFASVGASAADYTGKGFNYCRYLYYTRRNSNVDSLPPDKKALIQRIEERKREYQGAGIGVILGAAIGITIAVLALPYLAVGFVGVAGIVATVAGVAIIVKGCVAVFGSLISKTGRYLDWKRKQAALSAPTESSKLLQQPTSNSNLDDAEALVPSHEKNPSLAQYQQQQQQSSTGYQSFSGTDGEQQISATTEFKTAKLTVKLGIKRKATVDLDSMPIAKRQKISPVETNRKRKATDILDEMPAAKRLKPNPITMAPEGESKIEVKSTPPIACYNQNETSPQSSKNATRNATVEVLYSPTKIKFDAPTRKHRKTNDPLSAAMLPLAGKFAPRTSKIAADLARIRRATQCEIPPRHTPQLAAAAA